ncbi:DUF1212-domain-containing protein [Coniochaeta ligniaria NRRL 30616]|uniref:DUF1212-domain-containing protein n=1 Tax=Coniochaeta ligniaria NRRL 30616 TaxID=1408157 RepID=A0A1J7IHZ9_9PEZI|nr:DUF1212-domain-containing protein [Coniochaeta ligniaria NRRL 30616]
MSHSTSNHTSDESRERPQPHGADRARSREKKQVGFKNDPPHDVAGGAGGTHTPPHYRSSSARLPSRTETPRGRSRDSVNEEELTIALEKMLSKEHPSQGLPRPKPALRKSNHGLQTNQLQDSAETPEQVHRSEAAAKHRADRLAETVESWSAAGSRRNSLDSPLMTPQPDDALLSHSFAGPSGWKGVSEDWDPHEGAEGIRARRKGINAPKLTLNADGGNPFSDAHAYDPPLKSGEMTPTAADLEYVPRPSRYKSGVLSSLFKLYKEDFPNKDYDSRASTPNRTPRPSPPSSAPGTPVIRPRSGLFGLRAHNSASSVTTLSGLIGSSSSLAGPGSSNIVEALSEKAKHETARSKPKSKQSQRHGRLEEKIRIKVHIAEVISRQRYLVKLARALMMYGAPTHRLEGYMSMSARVLGIESQFLYLPGCMIISFDDSQTHTTEVQIVRVGQGVDLGRLHDTHQLYKEVIHDLIGVEEATQRLQEVMHRKDKFGNWVRVPMYGVASACVAPFAFEARFIDLPIAFLMGCILGVLQLVIAPKSELYSNIFEITAAICCSFLGRAFGSIRGGSLFCFSALAQSSLALILPGYMVLCSSLEFQSRSIIAGSVRMVYSLIYTLFLGYGITIGSVLYAYIDHNATSKTHCDAPLNVHVYWNILFVALFTICLCIINQAKWKQMPVMLIISLAGYCVSSFSSKLFKGNSQVSNTLGALAIGVLANLYARLGRHVENFCIDLWEFRVQPRLRRFSRKPDTGAYRLNSIASGDSEDGRMPSPKAHAPHLPRQIGYGLAAAAMLPAIFVQVPGGLAAGGSLLSGITSADQITGNATGTSTVSDPANMEGLNNVAFTVLYSVIQIAIGISVGLGLSALIVYPLGKRRSGLFSF